MRQVVERVFDFDREHKVRRVETQAAWICGVRTSIIDLWRLISKDCIHSCHSFNHHDRDENEREYCASACLVFS